MLACEDVHFSFGRGQEVLRGVTWASVPGQVTAILGPNGSGKTTLLRLLLGILEPTQGRVQMRGRATHQIPPPDMARSISYVPQRGGSEFGFTVRQVLELGIQRAQSPETVSLIQRVAADLSVTELLDRVANELSEGQRQRVTLARAIIQIESSPLQATEKTLLADEPFSAMDPRQERQSMKVLGELSKKGYCVVVVMHDLRATRRLAPQAVLLEELGRVKASGEIEAVLTPENIEAVFGIVE